MNVVLIGMPGSGKSHIGKEVARQTGMQFVDVDKLVEQDSQMSITKIFEIYGEKYFRDIEAEAICKVSKFENTVISTGGGAILRKENVDCLKENGRVFFINRDISNILKSENLNDRPLLKSNSVLNLKKLYDDRIFLYNKYADYIIDNNGDIEVATADLKNIIRKGL